MRHRIPRTRVSWRDDALAQASAFPAGSSGARVLLSPMDLSHFDTPLVPAPRIHFGYASITWRQRSPSHEDIAAVVFAAYNSSK